MTIYESGELNSAFGKRHILVLRPVRVAGTEDSEHFLIEASGTCEDVHLRGNGTRQRVHSNPERVRLAGP
jgi:hypothetical protein